MALSKAQKEALLMVFRARPDSIHEHDREPERWLRCTPQRTCLALQKQGLVDGIWSDYPIGNCKAHLTDEGLRVRRELRAGTAEARAAVRAMIASR